MLWQLKKGRKKVRVFGSISSSKANITGDN